MARRKPNTAFLNKKTGLEWNGMGCENNGRWACRYGQFAFKRKQIAARQKWVQLFSYLRKFRIRNMAPTYKMAIPLRLATRSGTSIAVNVED
jgi:hypothetical protein